MRDIAGTQVKRYITLDIVANVSNPGADDNTGRTLGDLKIIGFMVCPEAGEGAPSLHVRTQSGRTTVRDSVTDEIIAEGRGFARVMEALANVYDAPVIVQADPGVSGGKVSDASGTYGEQFAGYARNRAIALEPVVQAVSDFRNGPRVIEYPSTDDAYDAVQCDESITDGTILLVRDGESAVGFVMEAWPVAVTVEHGAFGVLTVAPEAFRDGAYLDSWNQAARLARALGFPVQAFQAAPEAETVRPFRTRSKVKNTSRSRRFRKGA